MQTVPEVVNAAALVERCKLILSLGDRAFIRGQVVGDNDRPERMAVGLCCLLDYDCEVVDHFVKELGLKYDARMRLAKSGYLTGERRAVLKAIIEAYKLGETRMKKADVKIGGEYYANVTNKKVVVRIDAENSSGGWDATNLTTNKKVRIKTAGRLQGPARQTTAAAETRVRKRTARPTAATASGTDGSEKKLSCVKAALQVLETAGEPMNTQEMITAMVEQNLWESPDGKTPHATLYSAILRDLKRGDESRFVKTERGRFTARA